MNKLTKLFLSVAFFALSALPSLAQTSLTATTLSAAVTANANTITVASATGITATSGTTATGLYINNEYMVVLSVSGTTIGVSRGQAGTRANAHLSGAVVLAGPPRAFYNVDPSGSCTAAQTAYTPYVNIVTGNQWLCSTVLNRWVPGWGNPGNSGSPIGPTAAVASAAGLITPSGPLFHVTGVAAITGFNSPVGFNGGSFCVIPDGIFTTTTANNIALASTSVVSKTLCWTYDKNANKFYPSY